MKAKIEKYVMELQHTLIVAGLNYEIWWIYKEKYSRKRFVKTLNTYPLFFQTSLHAHFVAMIIALYRLFENRKDTFNMQGLIKLLSEEGSIPQIDINRYKYEIKNVRPIWT